MRKLGSGTICDGCRQSIDPKSALRQGRAETIRLFHSRECVLSYVGTRDAYKTLDAKTYFELYQFGKDPGETPPDAENSQKSAGIGSGS